MHTEFRTLVCILALLTLSSCVSSPDLTPERAAEIIQATDAFADRTTCQRGVVARRVVTSVTATRRGADSLANCCYDAVFSWRWVPDQTGARCPSPDVRTSHAEFRFVDGNWVLFDFTSGDPLNDRLISVTNEMR